MGHLRHNLSNTDFKRSTDRSTATERRQSHDLAVNTESKLMCSKNVGDFDVRFGDDRNQEEYVEHQEFTWNNIYGRCMPLHSQRTKSETGFQTDLHDTRREVGYIERPLKQHEDSIEEQRHEIITFRLPRQSHEPTTEETYEAIVQRETLEHNQELKEIRSQIKSDNVDTSMIKSSITEGTRILDSTVEKSSRDLTKQDKTRSYSPEELVEESYEVISTLAKSPASEYLITTSTYPRSAHTSAMSATQHRTDVISGRPSSSEDDSSYCEEWTVTEAKRKQDGQTVKTIIDR